MSISKDEAKQKDVYWHQGAIARPDRERRNNHRGVNVWLTGMSASGKSTIADELEQLLFEHGAHCYRFDGDNVRHGLNSDLGFTPEDRDENIRRIGEVAKLFIDAGVIVITSFISPYRKERYRVRQSMEKPEDFIEVYVKCSIEECERRDPKGLYKKARAGIIKNYTGVSAPYEEPEDAQIVVEADKHSAKECARQLLEYLMKYEYLNVDSDRQE